jgi:high-affinity Fe2+/Pb2+ permease
MILMMAESSEHLTWPDVAGMAVGAAVAIVIFWLISRM